MQAENERSKQKAAIPSSAVQQSTIGSTGKLHRHDRQDAVNRNAEHEENMVADVDELSLSSTEESSVSCLQKLSSQCALQTPLIVLHSATQRKSQLTLTTSRCSPLFVQHQQWCTVCEQ